MAGQRAMKDVYCSILSSLQCFSFTLFFCWLHFFIFLNVRFSDRGCVKRHPTGTPSTRRRLCLLIHMFICVCLCWCPYVCVCEQLVYEDWSWSDTNGVSSFPDKPWFLRVCSTRLLKTLGRGEIACNEQFLYFPQYFLSILRTFCHFHQI